MTEFPKIAYNFTEKELSHTARKIKFSIKDFFSKCDQIRSFLWIWPHLLKKSLMENFIFCAYVWGMECHKRIASLWTNLLILIFNNFEYNFEYNFFLVFICITMSNQRSHPMEANKLLWRTNQVTDFYMIEAWTLIWVGFLWVWVEVGGGGSKITACLKLVRIMLETWNLVGKSTRM